MRSMASATIAFGMVSIPVKLYASVESGSAVDFNLLHKACGSRLEQKYRCKKEGVIVERDETLKGYEFAKDQYVTFSAEELKQLEVVADKTVAIAEFVKLSSVDTVYFDRRYYVGPDKGADRSYRLLARAMRESDQVAVARYAAGGKLRLVMLMAVGDKLVLQELHFADEVRSLDEVPTGEAAAVPHSELQLAKKLIRGLARKKFEPEKYEDEAKRRVLERIQAKVEGREIVTPPATGERQAQIIDLTEALKASLASRGASPAPAPRGKKGTG